MYKFNLIILFSSLLFTDNFEHSLSSQGFTGLINTPNSQVIKEGNAVFQFNNQFDNHSRSHNYSKPYKFEENYIAGIGFLSSSEFVGRLVESPNYARDLAVNIKFKIPYYHRYLPNIALGIQDIGGADNHYDNTYLVADKEIGFLRASLGYGKAGGNIQREFGVNKKLAKRMDGIFGGVEAKVTDWFSVIAEHDGKENHAAIRMALPDNLLSSVKLEAMVAQNITESQTHFAINLTVPLFDKSKSIPFKELTETPMGYTDKLKNSSQIKVQKEEPLTTVPLNQKKSLIKVKNRLVDFGFENVQVGEYKGSVYVKCENNMFDHTDLDALGYIIGTISTYEKKRKHYIVTLLKNNLQILTMSGDITPFKNYLKEPNELNNRALKNNLVFSSTFNETKVHFIGKRQNSSFFKPKLELYPGLLTNVGTEIGVLDYLVTLRANASMDLADGLKGSALYETPLLNSDDYEKHTYYANRNEDRIKSRLVNINLHQTNHYESFLNTLSVGQFETDYYGIMNQSNFTTISGKHGFNLKIGTFKTKDQSSNKNRDNLKERDIYLGSYRYFYQPLNLYAEIMYGQYWEQDQGVTLQVKRFFDQTSVKFHIKDVGYKYAGFTVTVPLTTRKSYTSKIIQIKGKKDFTYGLRTTLQEPSGGNTQRPKGGMIPLSDFELTAHYLDKDRLNASYIKNNLERMRKSYLNFQ